MKALLLIGVVNGFLAVALGAFGAHGLEGRLSEKMLQTWEKAVQYQMFHTVAILIAGMMLLRFDSSMFASAGWTFLIGIILFSGSLYIYSLSTIKTFAMITPIGGVAFLVGWVLLGIGVMKMVG
ncbi:DUF423 domain-containing protein [Tenuibacillus multivorans]|uniref:Uncharacterized membrane protein YgdD, TMEM256/DUF423 family n=1 Tax=Tenuibacillus multivorans TaxID=237069 RepID=A0A1G9WX89_9BACI|nr:DUF423 domain-containing protein [Tenuibacillus multivorans]GEL77315.1 membrane protein [Tenuibacillus multivorans]SDM89100.1 Uncharacterized membrane protein YgdD, TMEM256/DUF423 family [Tenuibacillus multivorans]